MISVYIDYPVPHFSIARNVPAESRMRQRKYERRFLKINIANLSEHLALFARQEIRFASFQELNDIWLEIDLGSEEFEFATLKFIQYQIGKRYTPLATAEWRYIN